MKLPETITFTVSQAEDKDGIIYTAKCNTDAKIICTNRSRFKLAKTCREMVADVEHEFEWLSEDGKDLTIL